MKKYYSVFNYSVYNDDDESDYYDCYNYIKWNKLSKEDMKQLPEESVVDLLSINKDGQVEKGTYIKVSKSYYDESIREELDGIANFIELNDNIGLFIYYETDDF